MNIYAYIRVSTEQQSLEAQRGAVADFALRKSKIQYFEDTVSGFKVHWRKRKLAKLIDQLQPGDSVVFPEISRISRKMIEILEVLEILSTKKVIVYMIKPDEVIDDSLSSRMFVLMSGLFAEFERSLISQRTKEGQAAARAKGHFAGRPKGSAETRMLDAWGDKIFHWLSLGLLLTDIVKLINDGREKPMPLQTLLNWMDYRGLPKKRDQLEQDEYKERLKEAKGKFKQAMKELKEKQEAKALMI